MSTAVAPFEMFTSVPATGTTTLYDVISALQDIAGPEGDDLVVATMMSLIHSGRLTWRDKAQWRQGGRMTLFGSELP